MITSSTTLLLELLSLLLAAPAFGRQLPSIFWNSSSSLFHRGDRGAILKAELMDSLEIHCPLYNDSVMLTSAEYSIIYMVSEYGYQNCVMDEERPVGHCYSPYKETILRLVIREFTPIPNGLEFEPGQTYYFISTSDGSMNGVHNRLGGLCASANMRFQIHVSDKASSHLNANSERVPLPPRELEDRTVAHSTVWPLKSIDSNQLPRTDESLSLPLAAKSPMEDLEQELPSHLSIYQLDRQLPPYTGEEDLSDPWRHHPRRPPLILYEIHEMLSPEDQAIGAYPAPSGAASQRLIHDQPIRHRGRRKNCDVVIAEPNLHAFLRSVETAVLNSKVSYPSLLGRPQRSALLRIQGDQTAR
uniref:Ephrin RBD domain-containing protein n=1 Tax=Trichuris muris TaxID=70415 RepID=A0A5S6QTQ3_TRIMR